MKRAIVIMGLAAAVIASAAFWLVSSNTQNILLSDGRAFPLGGETGVLAVVLKVKNEGGPDRLIGVDAPDADTTIVYSPEDAKTLPIPAKSEPSLAADGAYIRLEGVSGDLSEGRLIPLALTFEKAGVLQTRIRLTTPTPTDHSAHAGLDNEGAICRVGEGEPAPALSIAVEAAAEGWAIRASTKSFSFEPDLVDGLHIPGTGHGHLYLDGLKIQRLYGQEAEIGALPPGRYTVRVTLNTNDHRAYVVNDELVTASVEIEVP